MGPERLDRARTVESIPAATASSRALRASVGLVRYPPRAAGLAAGAAVCLLGAPAGGHGELLFPTVGRDAAGRSVGVGWRNRPCVAGIGIVPASRAPRLDAGLRRPSASCLPPRPRLEPHRGNRIIELARKTVAGADVERGADPALQTGKQPRRAWFQLPWPRSRACRFRLWIGIVPGPPPAYSRSAWSSGDVAEPSAPVIRFTP